MLFRAAFLAINLAVTLLPTAAMAGAFQVGAGSSTWLDTDPQGFTTIYIRNLGGEPGEVLFQDNQLGRVMVQPGETVELYGRLGRPAIQVSNTGKSLVEVVTRYVDRPRFTP